jgi:hypothetical protein
MADISRRPSSKQDLLACMEMYSARAPDQFMSCSRDAFLQYTIKMARDPDVFFHVTEKDKTISGFLIGCILRQPHMNEDILQQTYFCSQTTKINTIRVIKQLHDELLEFGKQRGIRYVLSTGSPVDGDNVFVRTLERHGWQRRGHLAYVDLNTRCHGR